MFRIVCIPTVILMLVFPVFGQYTSSYQYGQFVEDAEVYVFHDQTMVYHTPSADGQSADRLPLLYPVVIIEEIESGEIVDNYLQNWCKITYEKDGEIRAGYVLEGSLSMVAVSYSEDGVETPFWFIWSITGFGTDQFWQSCAKIVLGKEILSEVDFAPIYTETIPDEGYDYSVDAQIRDGCDLANDLTLFIIQYIYEACGYLNGSIYLTWNGHNLNYGFETSDVSEAGLFSVWTEVVFPEDEGGEPGTVKVTEFQEEFREEVEEYVIMSKETTMYHWDGQRLVVEE